MWEWFERTETATGYPNAFRICKVSQTSNLKYCMCVGHESYECRHMQILP